MSESSLREPSNSRYVVLDSKPVIGPLANQGPRYATRMARVFPLSVGAGGLLLAGDSQPHCHSTFWVFLFLCQAVFDKRGKCDSERPLNSGTGSFDVTEAMMNSKCP